jgi:GTP-binding protein YchF
MRIAIIGLPSSGKSTVFQALSGVEGSMGTESIIHAVPVPDQRVTQLSDIYNPKKTTYASVEFVDLGAAAGMRKEASELGQKFLAAVRPASALIHVIDTFSVPEIADESIAEAVEIVDTELVMADHAQCEKRLERLKKENIKSGPMKQEFELLSQIADWLAAGKPLRIKPELTDDDTIQGFAFLSAKPIITVVNTTEDLYNWSPENLSADIRNNREGIAGSFIPLSGQLESEIAELSTKEAIEFLADYGIDSPARERIIQTSYSLLGLMSFFTVGEDEVRAWTISKTASALEAASVIHSDIARGFIRAEVVDYETAIELGGFDQAKRAGKLRLEGKNYSVKNGDIISFRFNV